MLKPSALLIAIITVCCFGCSQNKVQNKLLVFDIDLEIFSRGQGSPLAQWLSCDKVVVYQNMKSEYYKMFQWHEYIVSHPHVKFVFVVEATDEERINEFLSFNKLNNYSIFWDRHNRFKKKNKVESEITFIAFLVDKENRVIGLSNPSIPDFPKRLAKLNGC